MKFGFIQGRLSPIVNGMIQAFPWDHWKEEFPLAKKLGLSCMEWTLDQKDIEKNPFNTFEGQNDIRSLLEKYSFVIPSITADCFKQKPFYKYSGAERKHYLKCLDLVIDSCSKLKTKFIIFPLVDNGAIENKDQETILISELLKREKILAEFKIEILFESDLPPEDLLHFISKFPKKSFGINYDSGDSAYKGFNVSQEFDTYFSFIKNIHIKDRPLGGTTVPFGKGDVDFPSLFNLINEKKYTGNIIIQGARAIDEEHQATLKNYLYFVRSGLKTGTLSDN